MLQRYFGHAAAIALTALVGAGVASAQATARPPGAFGAPRPAARPAGPGAGARQMNLSPQGMAAQAQARVGQAETIRGSVKRELDVARSQNDVVKTLCLDDKLNQVDVAITNMNSRQKAIEAAAKKNDRDLAQHEFTVFTVLAERTLTLDAEAKQCIGKELTFVDDSSVTVERVDDLPIEDPSEFPVDSVIVQPPQCSSCYR